MLERLLTASPRRMANNVCNGSFLIPHHCRLHREGFAAHAGSPFYHLSPQIRFILKAFPRVPILRFSFLPLHPAELPSPGPTLRSHSGESTGRGREQGGARERLLANLRFVWKELHCVRASVLASSLALPRWARKKKKRGLSCQSVHFRDE